MTVPARTTTGDVIESVIAKGDLAKLTPDERTRYYVQLCTSLGLNPHTQPFAYITLNGKLQLYAKRDAADQLRKIHGISIQIVSQEVLDNLLTIHVKAIDKDGRSDEDLGVVSFPPTLQGEARANAILKAVTKAKRRVTLSLSGLGFLDETEVADIPAGPRRPPAPAANPMNTPPHDPETGEVIEGSSQADATTEAAPSERSHSTTGGAATSEGDRVMDANAKLAAAAEQGMLPLRDLWETLEPDLRKTLRAALDRLHKPRAEAVDRAKQELADGRA